MCDGVMCDSVMYDVVQYSPLMFCSFASFTSFCCCTTTHRQRAAYPPRRILLLLFAEEEIVDDGSVSNDGRGASGIGMEVCYRLTRLGLWETKSEPDSHLGTR